MHNKPNTKTELPGIMGRTLNKSGQQPKPPGGGGGGGGLNAVY